MRAHPPPTPLVQISDHIIEPAATQTPPVTPPSAPVETVDLNKQELPVRTVRFAAEPPVEITRRTRKRRRRSRSVRFGIDGSGFQWLQVATAVINTLLLIYIAARIAK